MKVNIFLILIGFACFLSCTSDALYASSPGKTLDDTIDKAKDTFDDAKDKGKKNYDKAKDKVDDFFKPDV